MFQEFDTDNANDIVEAFHKKLSEHLLSAEASVRAIYDRSEVKSVSKLREKNDVKEK